MSDKQIGDLEPATQAAFNEAVNRGVGRVLTQPPPPEPRRPLRPNVTPETPPIIRLVPLIAILIASVPWFIGAWQIGRWILK